MVGFANKDVFPWNMTIILVRWHFGHCIADSCKEKSVLIMLTFYSVQFWLFYYTFSLWNFDFKSSLFWYVTQHNYLTLDDGTDRLCQKVVTNYQSALCGIPEEWRSLLHSGRSLKSHIILICFVYQQYQLTALLCNIY